MSNVNFSVFVCLFFQSLTILTYDIYFSSGAQSFVENWSEDRHTSTRGALTQTDLPWLESGGWEEREGGVVVERSDNRNQCTAESDRCVIFLSPRVVRLLHSLPWRTRKKMTTPRLSHPQRHTSHTHAFVLPSCRVKYIVFKWSLSGHLQISSYSLFSSCSLLVRGIGRYFI